VVYAFPGFTAGTPPKEPIRLADAYFRRAAPAVDHQLELAGLRLAAVLNDAFGGR